MFQAAIFVLRNREYLCCNDLRFHPYGETFPLLHCAASPPRTAPQAFLFLRNTRTPLLCVADDLGLHRMENPSHTDRCVSMHLYIPPFGSCKTFDEKTGHTNEVKMTFWSKFGKRTPFSSVSYIVVEVLVHSRNFEKTPILSINFLPAAGLELRFVLQFRQRRPNANGCDDVFGHAAESEAAHVSHHAVVVVVIVDGRGPPSPPSALPHSFDADMRPCWSPV